MAWNDTELSINGVDKDGTDLITRTELFVILDQIKVDDKSFQIEPFEIMDIARSENSLIPGQVIGRNIYSEQGKDANVLQTYLPLNSNIIQYPIVGEIWFGLHYGNETTKRYYLSCIPNDILSVNYNEAPNHPSALNEVSANARQRGDESFLLNNDSSKETKQGAYFKDISPRKVLGDEGDTLLQGRFGNYINLTSLQNEGVEDSSLIRIENRKSTINLLAANEDNLVNINSDTISINAKKDTFVFAENEINISGSFLNVDTTDNIEIKSSNIEIKSSTQTEIDSPKIDIGSDSLVPGVLGNKDFVKIMDIILSMQVSTNLTEIGVQLARPVPNVKKIAELTEENIELEKIKIGKTYLSKKLNVE